MLKQTKHVVLGAVLVLCLLSVLQGWLISSPWLAAAGGLGLCHLALRVAYFGRHKGETVY